MTDRSSVVAAGGFVFGGRQETGQRHRAGKRRDSRSVLWNRSSERYNRTLAGEPEGTLANNKE